MHDTERKRPRIVLSCMAGRGEEGLDFYPTITLRIEREGRWVFPGPEFSFWGIFFSSCFRLGFLGVRDFVLGGRLMTCLEGAFFTCS